MSYMALYRKWRPQTFNDVIEQENIVKILKSTIENNRIAHAYLFCGTRGTGKTTMAKIFSRAINCENPSDSNPCNECDTCMGILTGSLLDVIEIDAASNNSVDNIRNIRDEVIYTPVKAKYKVYIIDEVHMLSTGAFNALLKTLEEPPAHIIFILATTEPHKLPVTILSRCQRYDFKRITVNSISLRLRNIATADNINLTENASLLIARLADGALRDGISLLDQCLSLGKNEIDTDDVISIVGIVDETFISDVIDKIHSNDILAVLNMIEELINYGKDLSQFITDLIMHLRNVIIYKISNSVENLNVFAKEIINKIENQVAYWSIEEISLIIKELSFLENSIKWSAHPKTMIEVALIKLCDKNYFNNNLNLEDRILALEKKLASLKEVPVSLINNQNGNVNTNANTGGISNEHAKKLPNDVDPNNNQTKNSGNQDLKDSKSKNFLQVWPNIIQEVKNKHYMNLYQQIKGSNAIVKDNQIVEIVIYDPKPINIEFLNKPSHIEILESELSKSLNRETKLKYTFLTNSSNEGEDRFHKKIDSLNKVVDCRFLDDKNMNN